MQANIELAVGLQRLKEIVSQHPNDSAFWNEAQNRFHLVDRLLIECLGWDRSVIEVEQTDESGGRADYILGKPTKAILEAKREAKAWNLPPVSDHSKVRKIASLIVSCANFRSAISQVIPYCSMRGVPIGVISNGKQIAVFQAMTIGTSPLEGECYIFDGFDAQIKEFALLWEVLSPEGIAENRAYQNLARYRNPRIPAKAFTAIPEPMKHRYRSNLQEDLRSLGSLLLEEIEDNPETKAEFYRECYVPIEANNRHLLLSKRIIERRYDRASENGVVPASLDGTSSIDGLAAKSSIHAGSRPIVVIGDVGVGKTSFFENLFLSLDMNSGAGNHVFININLGVKASLALDIRTFVLDEVALVLKNNYSIDILESNFVESVYFRNLKEFEKSFRGKLKSIDLSAYEKERVQFISDLVSSRDKHLHACLVHVSKGQNRQITLVIDNADQRSFSVQQDAFLIAQELAATRNLLVFVALRPSTFYLSKTSGALSAYQNKLLSISPPPADEVVAQRLAFAVRVAEGKAAPVALSGIRLNLKSVVAYLSVTLRSVRKNEEIRQFLSNISGGNTRSVIELITSFCGSPNVDAKKIIDIETTDGGYTVPIHEFTKHALLGEYSYFNPQSSLVGCNIFDVQLGDPREHFLSALIIGFLSSNLGTRDNDGFVRGDAIVTEMTKNGFLVEQIDPCLRRLALKRLIETPHAHFREVPVNEGVSASSFHFRATSIGIYHIRFWCGSFSFLDATAIDTPIFDAEARERVFGLAASFEIADRFHKASTFRDYLENQWNLANFTASYYDFIAITRSNSRAFETVERAISRRRV